VDLEGVLRWLRCDADWGGS